MSEQSEDKNSVHLTAPVPTRDLPPATAKSALVIEPYWANDHVTSLIPCADDKWQRMTEDAKRLDGMVSDLYPGQRGRIDYDAHLCSMQRQQFGEGFVLASISTNIYGFCVRDTLNDGLGVLLRAYGGNRGGDGSAARAIEWARQWHAEDPTRRAVVMGYIDSDLQAEWDAAIAAACEAVSGAVPSNEKEVLPSSSESSEAA